MPVPRGSIPTMPSAASGTTAVFFTALVGLAAHRAAHRPGQYLPVEVEIDGVRHWRTYSITSPSSRCSTPASASCGPVNCTVNRAS
ncbi:hypothetical protein ACFY1L_12750 [Streptomyces sp. NPDC001663]|uniref:hypothetical protein n=1 Tax=Streptomyces sp. NPDC001663 TaxID=3364597 RepID=UPI0036749161